MTSIRIKMNLSAIRKEPVVVRISRLELQLVETESKPATEARPSGNESISERVRQRVREVEDKVKSPAGTPKSKTPKKDYPLFEKVLDGMRIEIGPILDQGPVLTPQMRSASLCGCFPPL
jgi:hypothetical protein